jgi:ribosomal protein S18 acetylase RimI-like enzyme
MGDHHVRLARPDDVPLLPGIGHAADRRFLDSPYPWIADLPPDDVVPFEAAQDRWCLWVATDAADRPVGFLCLIELMPGTLHVTHLAVDPAHGRRGLGGLTIEA